MARQAIRSAQTLRNVNASMPRAAERTIATTKLMFAMGMTVPASPDMNTIGMIILASLFLDESVGVYKAAGIAAGIEGVHRWVQAVRNASPSGSVARLNFLRGLILNMDI